MPRGLNRFSFCNTASGDFRIVSLVIRLASCYVVGMAVFTPITHQIIGCAIRVHSKVGPGLLEHVYQSCLGIELRKAGLRFELEVPLPVVYDGTQIACSYRADLLVEREVLVELKCVERLAPIHEAQTLTYLHLSEASRAILINFNVRRLKDGIRSFVRKGT